MANIIYDIKGVHAYGDLCGVQASSLGWTQICSEAVEKSGLHIVAQTSHCYKSGAIVDLRILSESSWVAVFDSENGAVSADCYTCGDEGAPGPAIDSLFDRFDWETCLRAEILRGDLPLDETLLTEKSCGLSPMTMAVSDVVFDQALCDESAFTLLHRSVLEHSEIDETVVLKKAFEPCGMTAVIAFRTKAGQYGHVDMHTYPERNYVSYTARGPAILPFNILAGTRQNGVKCGNISTYGRLAAPALAA